VFAGRPVFALEGCTCGRVTRIRIGRVSVVRVGGARIIRIDWAARVRVRRVRVRVDVRRRSLLGSLGAGSGFERAVPGVGAELDDEQARGPVERRLGRRAAGAGLSLLFLSSAARRAGSPPTASLPEQPRSCGRSRFVRARKISSDSPCLIALGSTKQSTLCQPPVSSY